MSNTGTDGTTQHTDIHNIHVGSYGKIVAESVLRTRKSQCSRHSIIRNIFLGENKWAQVMLKQIKIATANSDKLEIMTN